MLRRRETLLSDLGCGKMAVFSAVVVLAVVAVLTTGVVLAAEVVLADVAVLAVVVVEQQRNLMSDRFLLPST